MPWALRESGYIIAGRPTVIAAVRASGPRCGGVDTAPLSQCCGRFAVGGLRSRLADCSVDCYRSVSCCVCDGVSSEVVLSFRGDSEEEERLGLDAIVEAEYTSMLAIGVALLRDPDDAAELAQETMLRLQNHWAEVADFDRPGAWCRRVALNLATDMLRDRQRRRRLADRLAMAAAADPSDSPTERYWDEKFWAHVANLSERPRNVVVLHYVHDLSVVEIADTLNAPVGTIKSDLSRARTQLRSMMEQETP